MSTNIYKFILEDQDGFISKVEYHENNCMCSSKCYDDQLQLFEDNNPVPYELTIDTEELNWLILGLLNNEYKIKRV